MRRFQTSRLLWIPDTAIRKPMPVVETIRTARCGSSLIPRFGCPLLLFGNTASGVGMGLEVHLAPAAVGHVGVELGGREIGMAEHLLDAAQVGSAFEQVRGEGVPEQVRMHAPGLEPGFRGEPAQDEERARAREWPSLGIEKELRPVSAVQVRPAPGEVTLQSLDCLAAHRHEPFPVTLPDAPHKAQVEVHPGLVEADGLAYPQARSVEQLDERTVAEIARLSARRGLHKSLRLSGG